MTKLIAAAPTAPARKNADAASLTHYLLGSSLFVALVFGMFTVAGFHL